MVKYLKKCIILIGIWEWYISIFLKQYVEKCWIQKNCSRLIHDNSIAYLIECIVPIPAGFPQQTVVLYFSVLCNLWMRYYYAIRIQAPPVQSSVLRPMKRVWLQYEQRDALMHPPLAWMCSLLWWPWNPRKLCSIQSLLQVWTFRYTSPEHTIQSRHPT